MAFARKKQAGVGRPAASTSSCLSDRVRNELIVALAEFCGTFMFLFMAFCATQNALTANGVYAPANITSANSATLLFIAFAFGASLGVNVWVFFRVSGGQLNPVVSLALACVGAISPLRAAMCAVVQVVAGIAAAGMADALMAGPLVVANALGNGTNRTQGLFLEMFLTAQLVVTVLFVAVEKHKATFLAPVAIGASVFVAHLVGVYLTGTSVNPARSFGPAVIQGFTTYQWIYWLGPVLGSLLAVAVYRVLRVLRYATANPGQDLSALDVELEKATHAHPGRADRHHHPVGDDHHEAASATTTTTTSGMHHPQSSGSDELASTRPDSGQTIMVRPDAPLGEKGDDRPLSTGSPV